MSRSLTTELSPPVLQQCGLAEAFKWLKNRSMEQYGLMVDLDTSEDINPGLEAGVVLFRAVSELLFNIVKHAGVKTAGIRIEKTRDGGAKVEVIDQGSGFDPDKVRAQEGATGGFGLFNIRERLEMLGGRFEIESSPGCGSRFTLWAPFSPGGEEPANGSHRNISTEEIIANLRRIPEAADRV